MSCSIDSTGRWYRVIARVNDDGEQPTLHLTSADYAMGDSLPDGPSGHPFPVMRRHLYATWSPS